MKWLIVIISASLLSGCATIEKIAAYGAAANDDAVSTARFTLCNAASIGSIKRQFDTPEKVKTWKELCNDETEFEP